MWIVAKQALTDGHRPVYEHSCVCIVVMTVITKLRYGSVEIRLGRESAGTSFPMAIRTILPRFMYVPDGRLPRLIEPLSVWIEELLLKLVLPQRRHSVEEVIQYFVTFHLIAASDEDRQEDKHRESSRHRSRSR